MTHGSKMHACMHEESWTYGSWIVLDLARCMRGGDRPRAAAPAFPAPAGKEILGDPALTWACTDRAGARRELAGGPPGPFRGFYTDRALMHDLHLRTTIFGLL
jgi:hypothetical protein